MDYYSSETDMYEQDIVDFLSISNDVKQFNAFQCVDGVREFLVPLLQKLFGFTLLQLITYHTAHFQLVSEKTAHIVVTLLGITFLFQQLRTPLFIFPSVIYWMVAYGVDQCLLGRTSRGNSSILVAVVNIIFWQWILSPADFMHVRGGLMIMAMKLISYSFDDPNVTVYENLAYIFNPATVVFGPFLRFRDFRNNIVKPQTTPKAVLLFLIYTLVAMVFCVYSTCLTDLIPDQYDMLIDFKAAQSFRFGHYFICYMSLAALILAGFGNSFQVSSALEVEWPRSMSAVVVHWNYPMHVFLHEYIYRRLIRRGYFVAVLGSFGMSAMFHGFNFQLSAVLTSLAFYGYAESVFRHRLAHRLSACVKSRKCQPRCGHKYQASSLLAFCLNMMFVVLNIYHLIYLGMPFDGNGEETGYSFAHTIQHWTRWNFSSHLISFVILFLTWTLQTIQIFA